jgi:hypothetical protein
MVVEVYTLRAPNPQAKEGSIDWFGRARGTLGRRRHDGHGVPCKPLIVPDVVVRRDLRSRYMQIYSPFTVRTSMHDLSTTVLYITFAMFIRKARAGPGETRPGQYVRPLTIDLDLIYCKQVGPSKINCTAR